MKTKKGIVYLIGAGPGDPGLVTVKGVDCIRQADVVVYDYLAPQELLKYASPRAELIYVGKKGGDHTLAQDDINALIVEKATAGLSVARLKGGDPFIFGRGGEEAEELAADNIPFEIIPGVTSAIAAPAYVGIPLTHRKFTSTVAFITGHEDPTKEESSIAWDAVAKGIGTLVFLMGIKNLPKIVGKLKEHGMAADTPVAIIRWGTTPKQTTVKGTIGNIVERVQTAGLKAPAIIVVGDVVSLGDTLKWFEHRPLLGKRIVVTRAREQASDLVKRLTDLGADCIECPTIRIEAPGNFAPLDAAIENIDTYDWLVFTSVNGVVSFFNRLFENGRDVRAIASIKTAVIGPATEGKLREFGITSDIVPESYRAESVVEAFKGEDVSGKKILLPRAEEARPVLPVELRNMGAEVDETTAYCTKAVTENADILLEQLAQGTVDMITFTSSSTVKNFKLLLPEDRFEELLKGVAVASIGPITTETATAEGFDVHVSAATFTIQGLSEAILKYYSADATSSR
jgi:uroporphyrinogen III methyltransferase / synthase